jgi:hypothetical protein
LMKIEMYPCTMKLKEKKNDTETKKRRWHEKNSMLPISYWSRPPNQSATLAGCQYGTILRTYVCWDNFGLISIFKWCSLISDFTGNSSWRISCYDEWHRVSRTEVLENEALSKIHANLPLAITLHHIKYFSLVFLFLGIWKF